MAAARSRGAKSAAAQAAEQAALLAEAESTADNFIDLSGVEAVRGGAVPKGRYLTEVVAVKRGVTSANSKNPGAPKLAISFKVLENDEGEPASGTIFLHPVLTGDGAGRARGNLEDLGADLTQPFDPDDLVGTLAYLTVDVQKDNSNFNNVNKIELADESDAGDVDEAK